ncbi:MAG: MOSC domain-containing protein [Pirellulaceae bacterium]
MAFVASLTVFPIKSLAGVSVSACRVLPSGALAGDREFALVDANGAWLNGKRWPDIHRLRAHFDLATRWVELSYASSPDEPTPDPQRFALDGPHTELHRWLEAQIGVGCRMVQDTVRGFPDDDQAEGPTVISTATLETVARWYPGLTVDNVRRRFRANIEIGGVPPFWEDRLFAEPGRGVRFRLGHVDWLGNNPCQRCTVPARDPDSGAVWSDFAQIFQRQRRELLPTWAAAERFDHFYRLAVNTRLIGLHGSDKVRVGDTASVLEA